MDIDLVWSGQLGSGSWGRRPQISCEVGDSEICLVTHATDHWCLRGNNGARHPLVIERPQIFERAAASRHDHDINIVDAFDAKDDDEWELVEGEHFEFAGPAVAGANGRRPRSFSEEGVEALARFIEATEKTGVLGWFRERLFKVKQKRKQLLVSRRITQEFIEASSALEIRGDLAFVSRKTTVGILQTN